MEAVTHLEKVIAGEVSAVTHLEKVIAEETTAVTYTEKVIAGEAPPITHLEKVIAGVADPITHLEYVWAGRTPEPTEHEYTGAVPVEILADGTPILDFLISGNMEQSGTPTPQTPIQPQECGDLSENIYDASNPNIFKGFYDATSNRLASHPNNAFIYIPLVQGKKYYVYGYKRYNTSITIRWVTTSSRPLGNEPCIRTGAFAQTDIFTITAEANENYCSC